MPLAKLQGAFKLPMGCRAILYHSEDTSGKAGVASIDVSDGRCQALVAGDVHRHNRYKSGNVGRYEAGDENPILAHQRIVGSEGCFEKVDPDQYRPRVCVAVHIATVGCERYVGRR